MKDYREQAMAVMEQVNRYILGKEKAVMETMAAFLAGGNILLEDIPGVGKTTMALLFAKTMGLEWKRVQFTPDVMPSDLTGFSVYRKDTGEFEYQKGAVFCNLLLADEINRTTPKTQSALLEAMQEQQVTVEGVTRVLTPPFLVIATQNPLGAAGTQPLPPAQMDRFMISMSMGYPDFESEVLMAKAGGWNNLATQAEAVTDKQQFLEMQREVNEVFIRDEVYRYIVELADRSRKHPYIEQGMSPRGTIALVKMARAAAWLAGSSYVSPMDVAQQFPYVAAHRVFLNVSARMEGVRREQVVQEILEQVKKPDMGKR